MHELPLVLVTGSSGRIGRATVAELVRRGHRIRGLDRFPTPDLEDMVLGDLTDPQVVAQAMHGVSTLIHLAATPDDADFLNELIPNNFIGVYQVFEAARVAGVRRLVLASSGQVVWWQRLKGPWPISVDGAVTPRGWYAAGKVFLEAAGRMMAEAHGLTVLAVRLGWCPRTREQVEEIKAIEWAQDVYLSPADAGRFFAATVEADLRGFSVVYATSKPLRQGRYDLETTRKLVGFEPQDVWPQGIERLF